MEIVLNGETRQIAEGTTLAQLVTDLGLGERRVAVEINLEIVPRSQHPDYRLKAGDRVEVVAAIGGG
jgi:sulfur carrier protein